MRRLTPSWVFLSVKLAIFAIGFWGHGIWENILITPRSRLSVHATRILGGSLYRVTLRRKISPKDTTKVIFLAKIIDLAFRYLT